MRTTRHAAGEDFGEEREVTILFVDIRGSTSLAERRMPYDVIFLLNSLFAALAEAVENSGDYYSNFTGDGLMALFGLDGKKPRVRKLLCVARSRCSRGSIA